MNLLLSIDNLVLYQDHNEKTLDDLPEEFDALLLWFRIFLLATEIEAVLLRQAKLEKNKKKTPDASPTLSVQVYTSAFSRYFITVVCRSSPDHQNYEVHDSVTT